MKLHTEEQSLIHCISWGAIFAGMVTGLAIEALLNLLSLGLGFTSFKLDLNVLTNISLGSTVWFIVSGTVGMLVAGWIAGMFSRGAFRFEGALYGLITWALTTLLAFLFMATTAGMLTSSLISALGEEVNVVGTSVLQIAPETVNTAKNLMPDSEQTLNQVTQQAIANLNIPGKKQASATSISEATKAQLTQKILTLLTSDNINSKNLAYQQTLDFLQQNTNLNEEEAKAMIAKWQQQYAELSASAQQKTIKATQQITHVIGATALASFFTLVLGALAAVLGGDIAGRAKYKFEKSLN